MTPAGAAQTLCAVGAIPLRDRRCRFSVWAPAAKAVELHLLDRGRLVPMRPAAAGYYETVADGVVAGARYAYRLDGGGDLPDPASRCQQDGVHGPSQVVDLSFPWEDRGWNGRQIRDVVIYELHVGAFTPEGTLDSAAGRVEYLRELGVTAVELMPVAQFPGSRNWGYDGTFPFAVHNGYGGPPALQRFVNRCHLAGIAVLLDVVFNHFGPDGAYAGAFSRHYFSDRHQTPWGSAMNFDGEGRLPVRQFWIQNALYWIHEFHLDGLRFDATHAIIDTGRPHILAEIAEHVRASLPRGREAVLIAEDNRNLAEVVEPADRGGWGMDGVWADDFHHVVRRGAAGDSEGYFSGFAGTFEELALALSDGWLHAGRPGADPRGIPFERFVICLQNHDQVGNRARGERLHHQIDPAAYRALSALLLFAPHTPLLFMGQEWAAGSPFLYFTDHKPELGAQVTEGRRREFAKFSAFSDPRAREAIPDPQAPETFSASKLQWREIGRPPHGRVLALYRELLRLRAEEPALNGPAGRERAGFEVRALDPDTLWVRRGGPSQAALLVRRRAGSAAVPDRYRWSRLLDTEEERFAEDPQPIEEGDDGRLLFPRAGAVLFRSNGGSRW